MLHPAAGSLCRMTEVHRCWWQLIICYTLQKRDSVIDWWAVVYSRTVIVIQPFIIQSFQDISKLETCFFVKFPSFYNICLFVGNFRIWRNVISSRYSHTDCNSATVAKTFKPRQVTPPKRKREKLIIVFTFSIKREIISLFTWNFVTTFYQS